MGYLGLIVILFGVFIAFQGYTTHANLFMVVGVAFMFTGAAITPFLPWNRV